MIITETNNETIVENLKKLLEYRVGLTKYLRKIVSNFDIDLVRLSQIVLGQVKLNEITLYEYYVICWGFITFNKERRNFFKTIDLKEATIDLSSKTIKISHHVEKNRILEVVPQKYYTIRSSIKELNMLTHNGLIKETDVIKQTLISHDGRSGSLGYGSKRSIDEIRNMILKGTYWSVPITIGTIKNDIKIENGDLVIAGTYEVIDGYHTFMAFKGISEEKDFPVILNVIKLEDQNEMESIILQMDHKNTVWKNSYAKKGDAYGE